MKSFEYTELMAYFKSKHRLKDDDEKRFWNYITARLSEPIGFIVVDIMDVLTHASDSAAIPAGLLQKEYKEHRVVLDVRKELASMRPNDEASIGDKQ
jgi:hypothetical protein